MSGKTNGEQDFDPDEPHFSDEELEAALAGFEREFADDSSNPAASPETGHAADGEDGADANQVGQAGPAEQTHQSGQPYQSDQTGRDEQQDATDANQDEKDGRPAQPGQSADFDEQAAADAVNEAMADVVDPSLGFDNELAGLLGNKAKVALIVTRVASAELLAAFCQLSDIAAECVGSNQGAIAVLKNLDGDGPEAAAKDLTTVVSGMAVVLAVNRADKLEATMYLQGEAGQSFAPPVLFTSTPRFVEDMMLGIVTLAQLKTQGFEVVDSAGLTHDDAMQVLANHTKRGRGGRGTRIE